MYFFEILQKFKRYFSQDLDPTTASSHSVRIQKFLSFVDEKEEEIKNKLKRKNMESVSLGNDAIGEGSRSGAEVKRSRSGSYLEG